MRQTLFLLAWTACFGLTLACHGPIGPQDSKQPRAADGSPMTSENAYQSTVDGVRSALAKGDYEGARSLVNRLEFGERTQAARTALEGGQPREALPPLDRALTLMPEDRETLYLRGKAAFAAAETDSQPGFFYADACNFLRRSYEQGIRDKGQPGPEEYQALIEASQAAYRIPDPAQALQLARVAGRVQDKLHSDGIALPKLPDPLEKVWAEAAFARYIELKRGGEPSDEMLRETEDLLQRYSARRPLDPWSFRKLANLYLWEQRPEDARAQLEQALDLAPEDEGVYEELFSLNWRNFGWQETVTKMEELRAAGPASPYAQWYVGMADFYLALERFEATPSDLSTELWEDAEKAFQKSRELRPDFLASAQQYEASCRSAVGWCHYHKGELDAAERSFRSMESVYEGGMRACPEPRMPSGVVGLAFLAQKYHSGGQQDVEALEQAAAIGDFLFAYDPKDASLANNAGFLNRDAAVMHEMLSQEMKRRGEAAEGAAERANLLRRSAQERARAQVLMERSYAAYQVAAELAPDDVRIQNDAGLVMTYYLRTDMDQAERYLRRAIEIAERDEVWNEPDSDAHEAWGDAYQNLAVLYLTYKNDPARAKTFMTKALEIGPESRESQRPMLEVLDRLIAGESVGLGTFGQMIWQSPEK
ncbi:MAG: hypothetical protein H6830_11555 [Planctomycetes bacterium]|nr:hypothetical protein [Planctomycetota bacterium]MCB9908696.1 hypothetical protein [Planctomycetota bacterium]HPF13274.1 hypothetical protein [Planctomycetota bacterium]